MHSFFKLIEIVVCNTSCRTETWLCLFWAWWGGIPHDSNTELKLLLCMAWREQIKKDILGTGLFSGLEQEPWAREPLLLPDWDFHHWTSAWSGEESSAELPKNLASIKDSPEGAHNPLRDPSTPCLPWVQARGSEFPKYCLHDLFGDYSQTSPVQIQLWRVTWPCCITTS